MTLFCICLVLAVGPLGERAKPPEQPKSEPMEDLLQRVGELQLKVAEMGNRVSSVQADMRSVREDVTDLRKEGGLVGVCALAAAVFCAYWAQSTRRNSLLWFLFGLLLSPVAVIALLVKNAADLKKRRAKELAPAGWES
jgi:uncharacterized membrane protein YfcA